MPLLLRKLMALLAASGKALPAGPGSSQVLSDGQDGRQWAQPCTQEAPSHHQEPSCAVRVREPWHMLPRQAVGSPPWGSPKTPGFGPGQPALGVPAWAGVGPDGPRGPCQPQPFGGSVISCVACWQSQSVPCCASKLRYFTLKSQVWQIPRV